MNVMQVRNSIAFDTCDQVLIRSFFLFHRSFRVLVVHSGESEGEEPIIGVGLISAV